MKTLIMKEEQSRKEAEKLEASRLMAEAEEAKYAAYLEESGDFLNTNSGIRSGINDPFLDRAFVVEKLESELLKTWNYNRIFARLRISTTNWSLKRKKLKRQNAQKPKRSGETVGRSETKSGRRGGTFCCRKTTKRSAHERGKDCRCAS